MKASKTGKDKETALHWAVYYRADSKIIELLINSGSNLAETDVDGETALCMAIRKKHTSTALIIIRNCKSLEHRKCLEDTRLIDFINNLSEEQRRQLNEAVSKQLSEINKTVFYLFLQGYMKTHIISNIEAGVKVNCVDQSKTKNTESCDLEKQTYFAADIDRVLSDETLCYCLLAKFL